MLVGEVEYWWRGTHQMLVTRGVVVDWECFKRVFLKKYFPESVRHAKEAEFMRLHQGSLIVSDYAMRFEHLAHFYSNINLLQVVPSRKFAEGLKQELKRVVVPMAITEFPALVEKAKVVERLEGGNRVEKTVERPTRSKRGGGQRKPYDRPHSQQGGPITRKPTDIVRDGSQSGAATLKYYRCGGPHLIWDCPHTESRCFRWPATYQLALQPFLSNLHNVFHVSQLRKYVHDPSHVVELDEVQVKENLTYEKSPVVVFEYKLKELRGKSIGLVKVLWNATNGEATWEVEQ
uniref:Uncharacterized protein n=1 Tax=Cajanus cajan TaxID=3821 RepID=A0A151RN58_CAJCA|nr:hypothetical protein KK1_034574 [Cajanus cajan]